MFIDFAGMMTNINYIINIYKSENYSPNNKINNKINYCIDIKYNNVQNYQIIREYFNNEEERDKRFNEIINIINNK